MQKRVMRVCLLIFVSLSVSDALAQLFYDDSAERICRKAFIEKKEKIGDELCSVDPPPLNWSTLMYAFG